MASNAARAGSQGSVGVVGAAGGSSSVGQTTFGSDPLGAGSGSSQQQHAQGLLQQGLALALGQQPPSPGGATPSGTSFSSSPSTSQPLPKLKGKGKGGSTSNLRAGAGNSSGSHATGSGPRPQSLGNPGSAGGGGGSGGGQGWPGWFPAAAGPVSAAPAAALGGGRGAGPGAGVGGVTSSGQQAEWGSEVNPPPGRLSFDLHAPRPGSAQDASDGGKGSGSGIGRGRGRSRPPSLDLPSRTSSASKGALAAITAAAARGILGLSSSRRHASTAAGHSDPHASEVQEAAMQAQPIPAHPGVPPWRRPSQDAGPGTSGAGSGANSAMHQAGADVLQGRQQDPLLSTPDSSGTTTPNYPSGDTSSCPPSQRASATTDSVLTLPVPQQNALQFASARAAQHAPAPASTSVAAAASTWGEHQVLAGSARGDLAGGSAGSEQGQGAGGREGSGSSAGAVGVAPGAAGAQAGPPAHNHQPPNHPDLHPRPPLPQPQPQTCHNQHHGQTSLVQRASNVSSALAAGLPQAPGLGGGGRRPATHPSGHPPVSSGPSLSSRLGLPRLMGSARDEEGPEQEQVQGEGQSAEAGAQGLPDLAPGGSHGAAMHGGRRPGTVG